MIARTGSTSLVNLTPHVVVVQVGAGQRTFPSEGVARVNDAAEDVADWDGMTVVEVRPGPVIGLPDPVDDVVLIVSRVLAAAMPERRDLVFPFGEIRDEHGRIVAVSALARFARRGDSDAGAGKG